MKQIILAAFISLFFVACQNELPQPTATGSLEIDAIELEKCSTEAVSRAIDADLIVEIWQNGEIFQYKGQTFHFTNGSFPNTLVLPVGNYQVKAFNEAYQKGSEWTNSDLGSAIYYKEQDIEISDAKATRIAMKVPMVNIGVTFALPQGFEQSFSEYTFTVTEGTVAEGIALQEGQDGQLKSGVKTAPVRTVSVRKVETIYLNAKAFTVTLQAKNIDNEIVKTSLTKEEVTPGTVYTVAYHTANTQEVAAVFHAADF